MELSLHQSNSKLDVADVVFGAPYNEPLIHQVVTAYLAGGRAGTAKQKTKGEVSGGGRKPWKQKGTGRARAGSIRSPLWRGGGKIHAAVPRDHSQKVNKKMYRGAIRSIIAELARRGDLLVTEGFSVSGPKTKSLLEQLDKIGTRDVLIVSDVVEPNLYLSARNLPSVEVVDVDALNPVALLSFDKILVTAPAVKRLESWLS
jgi:large subunit ribosomal protein L4